MKTRFILSAILALSSVLCALSNLKAQVPQGFNYQAIARDGVTGNPIANATIKVKLSILSDTTGFYGGTGGVYIWEEEHTNVKTNSQGMFTIVLGSPAATKVQGSAGSFSAIDWSLTNLFIGTKIANPTTYKVMGSAKLWSVPYSMMADEISGSVKKLTVAGETTNLEEPLFEVKNKNGRTVFAVYNEGVRAYVSDGDAKAKKGGFAIGSFDGSKGERDLFVVTTDSIRAYIYDDPLNKGLKGGFAIGGFDPTKALTKDYLLVSPDSVRIYLDHTTGKAAKKGGFAIGSFDASKNMEQEYLRVSRDSVRVYIDDEEKKGVKGGFAIGSFNDSKAGKATFFDVSPNTSDIILSENRILWYPVKNAFLTGRVKIEKPDSVGENSFAGGFESKAKGRYSQALGFQAIARGDYSTAIGKNAVAHKINSFAFGENATARNEESYAFGRGAIAEGFRSYAFGSAGVDSSGQVTGVAYAKGDYSFAIGQGSQALGKGAFTLGLADTAKGEYSIAIGYKSRAISEGALSIGRYANALGLFSSAIGYMTNASSIGSTALGYWAIAGGNYALAIGGWTKANGDFSISMGRETTSSGIQSTAMGVGTIASGTSSTAMGAWTIASGYASLATGDQTKAVGWISTAIGELTEANGYASVATGGYTKANGKYSTSLGIFTSALGNYSVSSGYWTKAKPFASLVIGMYNDTTCSEGGDAAWTNNDPLFIVGNGSSDEFRRNAFTIFQNGKTAIGHASPTEMIDVNGNARFRSVGSGTFSYNLNLTSDGTLTTATSDISMKKNIIQITNALDVVNKLRGVRFTWKDDPEETLQIGMIAQEVEPIVPEIVFTNPVDGLKGINYSEATALLVEAIKEQQQQIESQKSELQSLREELEQIKAVLAGNR